MTFHAVSEEPSGYRRACSSLRALVLVLIVGAFLVASPAAAICHYTLLEQTTTLSCSSYDGVNWSCILYITNYWDVECPSGGGNPGNPPGGGGASCPSYVSVTLPAIDASVVGGTAFLRATIDSDGYVSSRASGPGADTSSVSGPGSFSFPVDLNAVPVGSNTYTVIATAGGSGACPPVSSFATGLISRSSATAIAPSSSGFVVIPTGGAFLLGQVSIEGYDAYARITASPAGSNLPTLWADRSVARVGVTPVWAQTQFSDVTANHGIGGIDFASMVPMQGSYIPADDPWNKTYSGQQQLWVGYPPVSTDSLLVWIMFPGIGSAQTPLPQPDAATSLQ